jgi:hypothetical protein
MHEISKWRPNSRWTPKRFYRLKLVYLIFLQIFLLSYLNLANFSYFIKKILKIQHGRKIQFGRFFNSNNFCDVFFLSNLTHTIFVSLFFSQSYMVKIFSIHPSLDTHVIQMGWNFLWLLSLMPKAYFQSIKILGQEV